MKKSILLLAFFTIVSGFSQQKIAEKIAQLNDQKTFFKPISLFAENKLPAKKEVEKVIEKRTFATINTSITNEIVANKYQNIALEIPFNGTIITVQLYKENPFSEGFHIDTDKAKNINYEEGVFYRGIIQNEPNSLVSFNFFKNECNGIVSSESLSNLVIAKLKTSNNLQDYIIYRDADLKIKNTFDCQTKKNKQTKTNNQETHRNTTSTRCATVYFEVDFDLYNANNSNVQQTSNWVTSLFNNVQTIYANDGISVAIKSIFVWTTLDPYEGIGTSSSDYLYKFHDLRPVFDGDVGQLLGIDPGGLGGVAVTVNGLCSNNNFSYSDVDNSFNTVPVYSWDVEVVTHELGHLLGSPHTHGCEWNGDNTAIDGCGQQAGYSEGTCAVGPIPSSTVKGTIMSYCHLVSGVGISFNNGFGPQPAARILDAVNTGTCLSTDCLNTCINNITSVTASSVSDTSATINWTEIGGLATSEISVFPFNATGGTWSTPTSPSFTANGLTPNTYYKALVRNNCSAGLIGSTQTLVFATTGDFCSGISLTDSGGASGNYQDFETVIRTIVPSNPNAKAKITFSAFDLELNYDYLYVYDGNDTTAPDLSSGGFTGNTIPAPIQSTASNGALTIKFYSDGGVVAPGYEATVSCEVLGVSDNSSFIDFSYYPNPTNGVVTLNSKNQMTELSIYNLQGRLLYSQKVDGLSTSVDLSNFAQGAYFFTLKFGDKSVPFKIMKI